MLLKNKRKVVQGISIMAKQGVVQVLCVLLFLLLSTSAWAEGLSSAELARYTASDRSVIIYSQKFIDAGEVRKAQRVLLRGMKRYPKNDKILSLYGQVLYQLDDDDKAERYLMEALRLNGDNAIALQYIELIRLIRSYRESEDAQEWEAVYKDKVGDLIVFIISIWLGTSLNSIWMFFVHKRQWSKAKASYKANNYDDAVAILVSHVANRNQAEIDKCLLFMLEQAKGREQRVKDLIESSVVRQDDQEVLIRSLALLEQKGLVKGVARVA